MREVREGFASDVPNGLRPVMRANGHLSEPTWRLGWPTTVPRTEPRRPSGTVRARRFLSDSAYSALPELSPDRPRYARLRVDVDVLVLRVGQNRSGEGRVGRRPRGHKSVVEAGALEMEHDGTRF